MNILIIGNGGREHVLAETYSKSNKVDRVIVAPGNDFIHDSGGKISSAKGISVLDFASVLKLVKEEQIELVDVAQDEPIAAGLTDYLLKAGVDVFGPTKDAAEIEWNKAWSRDFMRKYRLPTPHFETFSNVEEAKSYIESIPEQTLYIKASGLAGGKGAIRAEGRERALTAVLDMASFGASGSTFLIEECMTGEEFSLFAMCDGDDYILLGSAQDHKTVYDKDAGPNTGGMGCVSPTTALSAADLAVAESTILKPFLKHMRDEDRPYRGILYLGGMLTPAGVQIVEFNARWGDPEAQVILPSIQTDYLDLVMASINHQLSKASLIKDAQIRVSVTGCAKGYPLDYSTNLGKRIDGLEIVQSLDGIQIYGSGMERKDSHYVVSGGRVFHLVAAGPTLSKARASAYHALSLINIEGDNLHYRSDIGWRDLERASL